MVDIAIHIGVVYGIGKKPGGDIVYRLLEGRWQPASKGRAVAVCIDEAETQWSINKRQTRCRQARSGVVVVVVIGGCIGGSGSVWWWLQLFQGVCMGWCWVARGLTRNAGCEYLKAIIENLESLKKYNI